MAKLLLYIRVFPVSFILAVAAFIGTIWMLWPLAGTLWLAAIAGLTVIIPCALVEGALILFFLPD